ncbi:MAG: hypothetical protein E6H79_01010 [Betaproteobacteria bacterium]|nr:MAG: hypothetical protein E6H79_01010 [Betaproteobacteria bacterium]
MTETAWWLILGVALLLALAGALRFDVLGLFLRDRLEHPDETPGRVAANDAAPDAGATPAPGAHHPAHGAPHRKPHYHRSGGRKS